MTIALLAAVCIEMLVLALLLPRLTSGATEQGPPAGRRPGARRH